MPSELSLEVLLTSLWYVCWAPCSKNAKGDCNELGLTHSPVSAAPCLCRTCHAPLTWTSAQLLNSAVRLPTGSLFKCWPLTNFYSAVVWLLSVLRLSA